MVGYLDHSNTPPDLIPQHSMLKKKRKLRGKLGLPSKNPQHTNFNACAHKHRLLPTGTSVKIYIYITPYWKSPPRQLPPRNVDLKMLRALKKIEDHT